MAQVVIENIYKSFSRQLGSKIRAEIPETGIPETGAPKKDFEKRSHEGSAVSVLRRINLSIQDGEFMVLVGPSGCGKSTLLRLIAGLESITGGNIWVGDRLVNNLPPKQRDIAMVFQSYALYPHMTVHDNLAFGLRRSVGAEDNPRSSWAERLLVSVTRFLPRNLQYQSEEERAITQRVMTVAQMLQIDALLDRYPKQLSGGQKQRVALGRAMARSPQVFLMDEPLSNLDAKLRNETRTQIVNLQRKLGTTTIYVTHDQTEAMTMGDRIAVMNAGQIQQLASPLELYNYPANRFVAEFIGSPPMNFLPIQVKAPLLIQHPQFRVTLPENWEQALKPYDGRSLTLGIRPEHLSVSLPAPKNLPVRVDHIEALGSETYLTVSLAESANAERLVLQVRTEPDRSVSLGEMLWLSMAIDKIHLFDPESTVRIA
ncbi:MAG: ABC transporter ATP-binding protein [Drouetiella hepatica Uher 2000/2452]|uniref:ABC transporter ATP-binding protein n=1 Tax=Drouetiella hepatica Uher 2000/2452 TaxID=904376 RepID=A0A951UNK3_9CYAN|nr:ABC transporter ATP-binding protein [Drouetiella hepatica Uher 2000/2452]